jgi:hypothetical protein
VGFKTIKTKKSMIEVLNCTLEELYHLRLFNKVCLSISKNGNMFKEAVQGLPQYTKANYLTFDYNMQHRPSNAPVELYLDNISTSNYQLFMTSNGIAGKKAYETRDEMIREDSVIFYDKQLLRVISPSRAMSKAAFRYSNKNLRTKNIRGIEVIIPWHEAHSITIITNYVQFLNALAHDKNKEYIRIIKPGESCNYGFSSFSGIINIGVPLTLEDLLGTAEPKETSVNSSDSAVLEPTQQSESASLFIPNKTIDYTLNLDLS